MSSEDQIRAWKDPAYRERHSDASGDHPAGSVMLSPSDLSEVTGGGVSTEDYLTAGCCGGLTSADGFCSFTCPADTSTAQCRIPPRIPFK